MSEISILPHPIESLRHTTRLIDQVMTAGFPAGFPMLTAKDATIMRDQADKSAQPSVQHQQPTKRIIPLGCNACDACQRVSKLYDLFPACRECGDTFCEECRVTSMDDSESTGFTTVCRSCFLERQVEDHSALNEWLMTSGKIAPEDVERLRLMWADPTTPVDLDTVSRVGFCAERWAGLFRHSKPELTERLQWLATWCEATERKHAGRTSAFLEGAK